MFKPQKEKGKKRYPTGRDCPRCKTYGDIVEWKSKGYQAKLYRCPQCGHKYKPQKRKRGVFTEDEVKYIQSVIGNRNATAIRMSAIVSTMWRCQLRACELCELQHDDVDFIRGCLRVRYGKGNKERMVAMPASAELSLTTWIIRKTTTKQSESIWLFNNMRDGGRLSEQALQRMITYLRNKIKKRPDSYKLRSHLHSHGFRHSGASYMFRKQVNVLTIQAQLGHSNPGTTWAYLHRIDPQAIHDEIKDKALF